MRNFSIIQLNFSQFFGFCRNSHRWYHAESNRFWRFEWIGSDNFKHWKDEELQKERGNGKNRALDV